MSSGLQVLQYDATKEKVHSVTVFRADRAEVKRWIEVNLQEGQNEVVIMNLPTCLDKDSIRVDGIGKAVIFDVIYSPPASRVNDRHDALEAINKKRDALQAEQKILEHQADILLSFSKSLQGSNVQPTQLIEFLDTFEERQRKIDLSKATLTQQIKEVESEIQRTRRGLSADDESLTKRGVKITVVVHADEAGPASLSLTYVVANASWTPLYDVRAAIAHDSKAPSFVRLHYRASITQFTGEDWTAVELTLSTASPLQGASLPMLEPQWISQQQFLPDVQRSFSRMTHRKASTVSLMSARSPELRAQRATEGDDIIRTRSATVVREDGVELPLVFGVQGAVAVDGAVNATFAISGASTIPSNTAGSSETHKVSIAEIEFKSVELEWFAIPKKVLSVFLQCKVQNTSEYVLLPGQSNIFMGNSFVAKGSIPHVSPKETFSCSLGVDAAVRVTYHPQSKKTQSSSGFPFGSTLNTTIFRQRMTVKNTRATALTGLILKDQVPVSDDARIKVNVLEPQNLQAPADTSNSVGARKEISVKPGVKARWAQRNTEAKSIEGGGETGLGFVEWVCAVDPGQSTDIDLVWEVVAAVPWLMR